MASAIEELAAGVRRILDQVSAAERVTPQGQEQLGQAAQTLAQVTQGSSANEPTEIAALLDTADTTLTRARAALAGVVDLLARYLGHLGFTVSVAAPSPSRPAPAPDHVHAIRAALPPPVVAGSGQKTHGRWIAPDGSEHVVVSGRDSDSAAAWDLLQARGLAASTEPLAVSHVEQKVAARMVRDQVTHATLVINNRPCRGPSSCDTLLPVLLPAGYSLTVHGPNYRKTFTGGARPPWR